jgi:hypothetical protein
LEWVQREGSAGAVILTPKAGYALGGSRFGNGADKPWYGWLGMVDGPITMGPKGTRNMFLLNARALN